MSKIVLTIGHGKSDKGGYDSGAVSKDKKYHEYKIAREIGKYAQTYYNNHYSEQCDLMNYDGKLSLQERINKLKDNTYDFIAEIHLNAGGGTGTECYYHHLSARGRKYAKEITNNIAKAFNVKNRGAKTKLGSSGNDYFGIIRSTKPCAVLVETLFIDTNSDLNKIKTSEGQKKCGEAIAKAIASVRGVKAKTPNTSSINKPTSTSKPSSTTKKSVTEIAKEVIAGKWGNGADRKNRLIKAGYDYNEVQKKVNELLKTPNKSTTKKSVTEIAKEVIDGKWGNGTDRKNRLTKAGYNYNEVQKKVNELLK